MCQMRENFICGGQKNDRRILVGLNVFIPLKLWLDLALQDTYTRVPMVNNFHILLIFGILMPFALYGETDPIAMPNFEKDHFSRGEGLAHRHIIDIKRGPSGRLWVSTQQGLNYFDGSKFTEVFAQGKPEGDEWQFHRVRLTSDKIGNLIGIPGYAEEAPPFLLENKYGDLAGKIQPTKRYPISGQFTSKKHCYLCFSKSKEGLKTMKLLEEGHGFEEETEELLLWKLIDRYIGVRISGGHHHIDHVSEMNDGSFVIWIPGRGYLWIDAGFSELTFIDHPDGRNPNEFWSGNLPLDAHNLFWYPSHVEDGDLLFDNFSMPKFLEVESADFKVDVGGGIWIYSREQEGLIYSSKKGTIDLRGTGIDRITSIYPDEDGLLWIGTENGLFRLRFPGELFTKIGALPFSLNNPAPIGTSIRTIVEGLEGNFFTHENYGVVFAIDKKDGKLKSLVEKYPDGSTIEVLSMKHTTKGDMQYLLLGTPVGLFVYCFEADFLFKPKSPDNKINGFITGIHRDENEGYYRVFNADNQHFVLSIEGFKVEKAGKIPENMLHPLLLEGSILFGNTTNGLGKYNLQNGVFKEVFQLKNSQEIDHWDIRTAILTETELWLGTFEGFYGLDRHNYEVKYHIDKKGGLPGEIIYNMVFDGDGFWLGTDNGLTYIEAETSLIKSFFEWDGLSHKEFNTGAALRDSEGRVWMGGLNGINLFEPGRVKSVNFPVARLFLDEVEIFDTGDETSSLISIHRDATIEKMYFSPTENSLQFKLSHLNLSRTGGSTFSWYLEGFETPWANRTNLNEIWYRNMAPGNYTLRVRATDFRGIHSENELTIPFSINQFWYLSSWAVALWITLLMALVFLGTRYLYNRKLERHRLLQLQELDLQKTRLYTNITHEFKTPLTVILGLADRSKKFVEESNRELQHMLKTISHNGSQLLHLVNQMMALASIEHGQIKINNSPVQTIAFLKHLCHSFESLAAQKEITIQTDLVGSETDFHLIDSRKVQQVISNLISNAIKFSPENSLIKIRAGIEPTKTGDYLFFSIQDSGPGIPKEEKEKVFDRFHRVQSDLTNNTPGTGIGLALAKELVELLGGTIRVTETKVSGATFFFTLPLEKAETSHSTSNIQKPAIDSLQLKQTLEGSKTAAGGRIKNESTIDSTVSESPLILLVEDHLDVHQFIRSCIPEKYRTISAMNGNEGYELAVENVPDLIISDVMMPEMDGYTMCEKLKSHKATSHIPIVLLTAKSDTLSRITGLKQGADAYLAKPFDKEELLIRIDNMFNLIDKLKQRLGTGGGPVQEQVGDSPESAFLKEFYQIIESEHHNAFFGTSQLSDAMHLSRSQLYRKIKALTDDSPSVLLKNFRLEKGRELLNSRPGLTINEVAIGVGFSSGKYFSEAFLSEYGVRPRTQDEA